MKTKLDHHRFVSEQTVAHVRFTWLGRTALLLVILNLAACGWFRGEPGAEI